MHHLPTENIIVNPCPVQLNIAMNDKLLKGLIRQTKGCLNLNNIRRSLLKFTSIRISIKLPKPIHSSYRMTQPPADPRGVIDYGDVDFNQDADYF